MIAKLTGYIKQLSKAIWQRWTAPPPQTLMLEMLKQVAESNRAQTELFATLLKAWTAPAPAVQPYVSPEDRELLADLEEAANAGDEDARLIWSDDKLRHQYLSNFR